MAVPLTRSRCATAPAREEAPALGHRKTDTPELLPSSSSPLSPLSPSSSLSHPSQPLGRRTRGAHSDQRGQAHGLRHAEPAQHRPHRSGRAARAAPPHDHTVPPQPARRLRLRGTFPIPPQPQRPRLAAKGRTRLEGIVLSAHGGAAAHKTAVWPQTTRRYGLTQHGGRAPTQHWRYGRTQHGGRAAPRARAELLHGPGPEHSGQGRSLRLGGARPARAPHGSRAGAAAPGRARRAVGRPRPGGAPPLAPFVRGWAPFCAAGECGR